MVNELPAQMDPLFTAITGLAFTVTCAMACDTPVHPAALPDTVYEVLTVGLTVDVPPLKLYESAPEGDSVKTSPAQMAPLFTVIFGAAFTAILATAGADIHPAVLFPITEYDAEETGLTVDEPLLNV